MAVTEPWVPETGPLTRVPEEPFTTCQCDDVPVTVALVCSPSANVSSMIVAAGSVAAQARDSAAIEMRQKEAGMAWRCCAQGEAVRRGVGGGCWTGSTEPERFRRGNRGIVHIVDLHPGKHPGCVAGIAFARSRGVRSVWA